MRTFALKKKPMKRKTYIALQCYLILAIPLLGFCLFSLRGIGWAVAKSFYYYTQVDSETRFVGFDNYLNLFKDVAYWRTWKTTLLFALYKVPIEMPIAAMIAWFLNKKIKGTGFFRAVFYMPTIVSVAIIGIVFTSMFEFNGIINVVLQKIGLIDSNIDWFSNSFTALTALTLGSIWGSIGINIIYMLAAYQNVPEDLYEAAYLEGMGKTGMFFKITLPIIAPVFQVIILLAINGTLSTGDYIIATTGGAPGGATNTVVAYQNLKYMPGFAESMPNLGYGSAMSTITAIILAVIALLYIKTTNKLSNLY